MGAFKNKVNPLLAVGIQQAVKSDGTGGKVLFNDGTFKSVVASTYSYKGEINVAANFPVSEAVVEGDWYSIGTAVTDNDVLKTNTGLSFVVGEEIYWNGTTWGNYGVLGLHPDSIIQDTDGDTYIAVEKTVDNDKIVAQANKTGNGVIQEWRDGNGDVKARMLANSTLAVNTLVGKTVPRIYLNSDTHLRYGRKIVFNVDGSDNTSFSLKAMLGGGVIAAERYTKFYNWGQLHATFGAGVQLETAYHGNYFKNVATNLIGAKGSNSGFHGNSLVIHGGLIDVYCTTFNYKAGHTIIRGGKGINKREGGATGGNLYLDGGIADCPTGTETVGNILIGTYIGNTGIGNTAPTEKLDVAGTTKLRGIRRSVVTTRSDTTLSKNNHIVEVDASDRAVEIVLLTPNTSNGGQEFILDIYDDTNIVTVIAFDEVVLDVNTITNTVGDTWRYTFNGTPDLSSITVGDTVRVSASVNVANTGDFIVTGVDDTAGYIEVTNIYGVEELTDSTGVVQVAVFTDDSFVAGETRTYVAYAHRNTYKRIN